MAGQLILDTGALIGWQRNDPRVLVPERRWTTRRWRGYLPVT
jgi:hypothetical protein